jgi:hypothetical protein
MCWQYTRQLRNHARRPAIIESRNKMKHAHVSYASSVGRGTLPEKLMYG